VIFCASSNVESLIVTLRREKPYRRARKIREPLVRKLAGPKRGVKEVEDGIWLVSFMEHDPGYIDLEQKAVQTIDTPFGPKMLPMSQLQSVTHVAGPAPYARPER